MSASKRPTRTRNKRHRQEPGRWFALSIALHVVAAVALIYLTPLRDILTQAEAEPERLETTMSSEELDELGDLLEKQTSEQVRRNVEQLQVAQREMRETRQEIQTEFAAFERRQVETAPEEALNAMQTAAEELQKAVEELKKDKGSVREIDRAQALAEQAQNKALEKLAITQKDPGELAAKQKEALKLHQEAKKTEIDARQKMERVERRDQDIARQQEQVQNAQEKLKELKKAAAEAKKEGEKKDRQKDVERQEERVKRFEDELAKMRKQREQEQKAFEETRANAVKQEQQALEVQKLAVAEMQKRVEELKEQAQQQAEKLAQQAAQEQQAAEQAQAETEAMDVAELYDHARQVEDKLAETFKKVRAMDLAMVRDMTLEQAMNDIDVARPVRPELNKELLREKTTSDEELQAQKQEMAEALRQTGSMMDLARRMLEMANQSAADLKFGDDFALATEEAAGVQVQQEQLLEIRDMASEDVSGDFVDVSGMMQAMAASQAGQSGQAGAGAAGSSLDYKDTTEAVEAGADAGAPLGFERMEGEGDAGRLILTEEMVDAAARKVVPSGEGADFMFVDTWYTLGPFPNPDRVNIDREFPPDSLVDLDATYVGKGGRPIEWQFVQSDRPIIIPPNAEPYGIWYAYTEVYFDEARDVIIAVGSDDRGILKINGIPVWISSKRLKGWFIDEAWRKVHFKQGINRLLFRIENGHLNMGFSLTMRLTE